MTAAGQPFPSVEPSRAVSDQGLTAADPATPAAVPTKRPLYPRLLRLRHVHPNAWQRALLGEGAFAVAGLLVLADLATAWIILVLPVAVAVVVKAHDLLAARLADDPPLPSPGG
jgi:hypothetical protein